MNIQLPVQMDKPEFLAWVERQEARYELSEGRVVMMVGASLAHGLIVANLIAILKGQVDPKEWLVVPDHGLDLGPKTLRYPDIVIERAGGDRKRRTATAPILLAEVLSPSTAGVDLGDKAAEYLQLPSLAMYLVFSQDEPKAWIWSRGKQGFPSTPTVAMGQDKIIQVAVLGLTLPLGAVYAGV
jgi:Uma2 family endonuclease